MLDLTGQGILGETVVSAYVNPVSMNPLAGLVSAPTTESGFGVYGNMGSGFGGAGSFISSGSNGRHASAAGLITPPQLPPWALQVTQQAMDWLYDKALEVSHELVRKQMQWQCPNTDNQPTRTEHDHDPTPDQG